MTEVRLHIQSQEGDKTVLFDGSSMTVGRGESAQLKIADASLSRLHASLHREGDRLWVLDEDSVNGTFVNAAAVPPRGTRLSDGDVIRLGDTVTIVVRFAGRYEQRPAVAQSPPRRPRAAIVGTVFLGVLFLGGVVVVATRQFWSQNGVTTTVESAPSPQASPSPTETPIYAISRVPSPVATTSLASEQTSRILYSEMDKERQYEFLIREARRVTVKIGNREYEFERKVLDYIKTNVDGYAKRVGTKGSRLWAEDLNFIFERAKRNAPFIIASFRKESVPVILGLYIPMIETEYNECLKSLAGAQGLFQFMPDTARGYGVDPSDRCKIEKMAPAAARYMKDRILEFGNDGMSVALGIAAYNRSPQSVRRDLQEAIDGRNNERSFWTLLAKIDERDVWFQRENSKYVPKFFAAAIVGENPEAFGLQIRQLSTYDQQ